MNNYQTVANQKVVRINKPRYRDNFLQVGIDEWQTAFKELKPSTFAVYLYLASNADGFNLALSKEAVENAIGIKKTAYHSAIKELEEKGYIQHKQGNIFFFNTKSANADSVEDSINIESANANSEEKLSENQSANADKLSANADNFSAKTNLPVRKCGIEIDKIDNTYRTNKGKESKLSFPPVEMEEGVAYLEQRYPAAAAKISNNIRNCSNFKNLDRDSKVTMLNSLLDDYNIPLKFF